MRLQMCNRGINIVDAKRQVAQTTGFRTAWARRRERERKQLDNVLAVQRQVALPRITLGAVELALQRKPEDIALERFALRVVCRDDGNMVNSF